MLSEWGGATVWPCVGGLIWKGGGHMLSEWGGAIVWPCVGGLIPQ